MKQRAKRYSIRLITIFIAGFIAVGIYSYLTNPFVRFSIIRDAYTVRFSPDNIFHLENVYVPSVVEGFPAYQFAYLKSGWHIISNRFSHRVKPVKSPKKLPEIITDIHTVRFNPKQEFLISGDHFSVFYPRSLGIFYHTALDSRTALNRQDWLNRQAIYAKSTAYALQIFSSSDRLSTTIVPISRTAVTLMNIYAPPSDTLYSLLYALKVMSSDDEIKNRYPIGEKSPATTAYPLLTKPVAQEITRKYKKDLQRHWKTFFTNVYDGQTGLVKKDIRLSGTKDMAMRSSAFYDNVMVWATNKLAQELKIIPRDEKFLKEYKARIIYAFWEKDKGFFSEDLGSYKGLYSSDWLIAYQSGFLNPSDSHDRMYLQKSVDYIHINKIDRPFGLRYHPDLRREQLYLPVRLFAPDYGSRAIWSHWGIEYIKLLTHLNKTTQKKEYLQEARQEVEAYKKNMIKYNGYPEVYSDDGKFFAQRFYESVLTTGWVVNFELAAKMVSENETQ